MKVLSEDGMTKVYQVDGSHRVEEICRQMVARNHALNDKSWSLVEELPDLDLGKKILFLHFKLTFVVSCGKKE